MRFPDNDAMIALACPGCSSVDVIRFGTNRGGSARCRCKECLKTFTPKPNLRSLTPEKEAAILRALAQRISQVGIAQTFKVSRNTVRAIRKKTQPG